MVRCSRHIAGCLAMLAVTLLSQSSVVVVVAPEASPPEAPPPGDVTKGDASNAGLPSAAASGVDGEGAPKTPEGVGQQQQGVGGQQQEGVDIIEMNFDDPYAGVDLQDAQRRENVLSGGRLKKGEMRKAHLAEEAVAAQINAEHGENSMPIHSVVQSDTEQEDDGVLPKLPFAIAREEPSVDVETTPEWLFEKAQSGQQLLDEQKKLAEAKKRSQELYDEETERDLERGLVDVTDDTINEAGEEVDESGEVKKKKINPFMEGLKGVGNFLAAPFRLGWGLITKGRETVKVEKEGFKRFFRLFKNAVGKTGEKDGKAGQAWKDVALDGWRGITSSPERKKDLLKDIKRAENIQKLMQNQKDTKTIQQIVRETEEVGKPKITRLDDFIKKKYEKEAAAQKAE